MPDVIHNTIALFADDAKVFSAVESDLNQQLLQEDLLHLQDWAAKWQLNFNATKCKVLHLGAKNAKFSYHMEDVILNKSSEEKDLGVWVDDKLKFSQHIEKQVNKANKQLGLIRRSFDYLDPDTFNIL